MTKTRMRSNEQKVRSTKELIAANKELIEMSTKLAIEKSVTLFDFPSVSSSLPDH